MWTKCWTCRRPCRCQWPGPGMMPVQHLTPRNLTTPPSQYTYQKQCPPGDPIPFVNGRLRRGHSPDQRQTSVSDGRGEEVSLSHSYHDHRSVARACPRLRHQQSIHFFLFLCISICPTLEIPPALRLPLIPIRRLHRTTRCRSSPQIDRISRYVA